MSLGRLVPWASWDEWRQVGNWLFSLEPEDVRRGIDRVAVWRARGRLPLGVDITACLVETRARDHSLLQPHAPTALSDSQLRLQYAMALVRMVNGIADSAQKGRVAASVASLAAAAGLPRILVDLRHESTHNELPSSASLRLAADQALAWLQLNYWQRQGEHLQGCGEKIRELVQEYVALHAAAAAKVASQAGDEFEDDTTTALTAALAAGRRGLQPGSTGETPARGGGGVSSIVNGGAVAGVEGYSAVAGQRRRKAILAELRMGVPRPAASLLVEPLLVAGASETTLAATAGDPSTLERALATALPHFVKDWPQLPAMLLRGAVQHLAAGRAGCEAHTAQQDQGSMQRLPLSACLSWVNRLLPPATVPGSNAAAGGGGTPSKLQPAAGAAMGKAAGGEAMPSWVPSPLLLQELVGIALPALLECSQQAALEWMTDGSAGVAGGAAAVDSGPFSTSAVAMALQRALRMLLDSWRGSGASSAMLARCTALLVQAQLPHRTARVAGGRGQQAAAEELKQSDVVAHLEEQLAQAKAKQQAECLRLKRLAGTSNNARPAKLWRRTKSWAPCSLGLLPSASDTNGRPPPREIADVSHSTESAGGVSFSEAAGEALLQQQGEPGGGAAVDGSSHAVRESSGTRVMPGLHQELVSGIPGGSEVVDRGDQEVIGVWPLPDGSLHWAVAAMEEKVGEADGGSGNQEAAPHVFIPSLELLV